MKQFSFPPSHVAQVTDPASTPAVNTGAVKVDVRQGLTEGGSPKNPAAST